jgi:hypothetical protein
MRNTIAALVAFALSLGLAYADGWFGGHRRAADAAEIERALAAGAAASELAAATARHAKAERDLRGRLDTLTINRNLEIAALERSKNDLAGRLRAGAVRMSIPAAACLPAASADPAAGDQPARAELAPETALALDGIAADGDAAIIDLNTCLAAYETARATVAAPHR